MGVALVSMVAKLSAKKAKSEADRDRLTGLVPALDELMLRLLDLSQADVDAYRRVIDARKAGDAGAERDRANEGAAEVPLQTASAAVSGLKLAAEVSARAWDMTASDLTAGIALLQTGLDGALSNVAINLPELRGAAADRVERAYLELRSRHER